MVGEGEGVRGEGEGGGGCGWGLFSGCRNPWPRPDAVLLCAHRKPGADLAATYVAQELCVKVDVAVLGSRP